MKKILALLLAITMIAAFCACAQKPADTTPADTSADTVPFMQIKRDIANRRLAQ